jgi:chromosome segregation ATPase
MSAQDGAELLSLPIALRRRILDEKERLGEVRSERRALAEIAADLDADFQRRSDTLERLDAECAELTRRLTAQQQRTSDIDAEYREAAKRTEVAETAIRHADSRIRDLSARIQLLEGELDDYRNNVQVAQSSVHGAVDAMVRMNYKLGQAPPRNDIGSPSPTPSDPDLDE